MVSLNDEVVLKGDSILYGSITALGEVELEDHARSEGSVTTAHNLILKNHSVIAGDATASGEVQLSGNSVVSGNIQSFVSVPPIPPITPVKFSFHAGTQNIEVEKEATLALDPGSYKDLEVGTEATVTLRSGHYVFKEVVGEDKATLAFDLSSGPIVIDVVNELELKERVHMLIISPVGDAADILFRIGGDSVYLTENGVYLGTFLGLDAEVTLGQNAELTGALYGKEVTVRERTHFTGKPAVKVFADLFIGATP